MMRKFYRFRDDMNIPGRWHLDDPIDDEGSDPRRFNRGITVDARSALSIDVQVSGMPLDFTLTAFVVPIASSRLTDAFARIAASDFQRVPVTVGGKRGYEIVNATKVVQCVDENRSEFIKWTELDGRTDLVGQHRMFAKLLIDPGLVPSSVHLFPIYLWEVALIASEELMEAARSINATGPLFQPVVD